MRKSLLLLITTLLLISLANCKLIKERSIQADKPQPTQGVDKPDNIDKPDYQSLATSSIKKVLPIDEADKDPSFRAFREKLIAAVNKRDQAYILTILDTEITNSFGGKGGIDEFKEVWQIDKPDSKFWPEMAAILKLGGKFEEDTFCAPYVFGAFPDELDSNEYSAIISDNVSMREKPAANAKVIAKLSYDIVKFDYEKSIKKTSDNDAPVAWAWIETADGKAGYVPGESIRSALDYRACFVKKNGKWVMDSLLSGD